jgi:hypothetical protein
VQIAIFAEIVAMSGNLLSDLTSVEVDPLIWFENNRSKLQNLVTKLKSRKTQESLLRLGKILEDFLSIPPENLRSVEAKIARIKDKLLELKKTSVKEPTTSSTSAGSSSSSTTSAAPAKEEKAVSSLADVVYDILCVLDDMLRTGNIDRNQLKGKVSLKHMSMSPLLKQIHI